MGMNGSLLRALCCALTLLPCCTFAADNLDSSFFFSFLASGRIRRFCPQFLSVTPLYLLPLGPVTLVFYSHSAGTDNTSLPSSVILLEH